DLAQEAQKIVEPLRIRNCFAAELLDERSMRHLGARAGLFRHRFRKLDQAAYAFGQRAPIRGQIALVAKLADAQQEREQAAVPVAKVGGVESQPRGLRRGVELLLYQVLRRQAVTKMPITGQSNDQ